ncbi:MAG: phosphate acyltransferase PlsX [Tissierellia bacterium]|nr:phosphate acyltransferase PlsX [Tissierellia bacterium]
MRIIIDTLGSDAGYAEIVSGVLRACDKTDSNFLLIGPEQEIRDLIQASDVSLDRFEFIDTREYINNEDEPVKSIRRKKDSSTVLGLNKLNEEAYDGFISAGSTGALLAGALFITKRIDNIERAILSAALPSRKGPTIFVDTGAVMDSSPHMQEQFALMGSIYAQKVLNIKEPKVYLLNVGVEEGKGDMKAKKVYELLKENPRINFQGNIESRDILSGKADVIVTDGFAGNILIKGVEGIVSLLFSEIKAGILSSFKAKLGGLLLKDTFKQIAKNYNYKEIGAVMLLGVKKPIFKAHGSSDAKAIMNAILTSEKIMKTNIIENIEEEFKNDRGKSN